MVKNTEIDFDGRGSLIHLLKILRPGEKPSWPVSAIPNFATHNRETQKSALGFVNQSRIRGDCDHTIRTPDANRETACPGLP
jgi:hypothetical protein